MKTPIDKKKRWKEIYILGTVSLFNDFASEMIYPLIPVFVNSVLGLGATFLGVIEGVAESANSILKLLSGILSDKVKKRKIFVVLGYTISNLTRPLIGIVNSWGALLGLRFSDRVGKGIRTSPRDAMIASIAPPERRGFAFGFQRSMDHAGAVLGPLVASALMTYLLLEIREVFLLSIIPGIIVILLTVFGIKEAKAKNNYTEDEHKIERLRFRDFKKLGKNFSFYLIILIIFTLGNSTDAFLLLRASDMGLKTSYIPLIWAFLHVSKSLFCSLGGYFSDKLGRKRMIISGWLVYFLTYIGFAFLNSYLMLWVLFGFYGLYFGLTEGVERALVSDMVEKKNLGMAYGFYNLVIGIGALPASVIFGLIWKTIGYKFAFITGSLLALVAAIMISFLNVSKK